MKNLFNWKKNPKSVFIIATPLFIIGFGSSVLFAVLKAHTGDFGYVIVLLILSPLYYMLTKMIIRII